MVVDFADGVLSQGQPYAPALHYSPLPAALVEKARAHLKQAVPAS